MAQLPSTSKRRDFLESTLIHNFWDQLLHPPVPWAYQLGPLYRAADGYGNNPSLPDVGMKIILKKKTLQEELFRI